MAALCREAVVLFLRFCKNVHRKLLSFLFVDSAEISLKVEKFLGRIKNFLRDASIIAFLLEAWNVIDEDIILLLCLLLRMALALIVITKVLYRLIKFGLYAMEYVMKNLYSRLLQNEDG